LQQIDFMKAIILAGGKGTRLGALTKDIPKPMVPLLGKPLVQYQVELCKRYGLSEIIFIVNHLKEPLIKHFGNGEKFGIKISYFEEPEPLGTVGGLKEIEDQLDETFLVLYGDVLVDMDLNRLFAFHHEKQSEATLVVHPNDHPYDSDLLELDEDERVIAVHPKPHKESVYYHNMVNAATYVFSPKVLTHLEKGKKADFGKDIFPGIFDQIRMFGYNTSEYLKDMGTPDRLDQVSADVESGKVKARNLENRQKCIFLDRDGVINPDYDLIHRTEDMELYPWTAEAVKRINKSNYLSVLTTNQSVVARNLTTIKGLGEIHKKMESLLGDEGAKLDAIKFCPHHPDGGFEGENPAFKTVCECRKPKAGMHKEAAAQFNIDLSESYMIGDSERDTLAGKNAGCVTLGLRTGHGHKKAQAEPDYMFDELRQAVDFILDEPYKDVYDQVWQQFKSAAKKPFVISLAGNSRSGKSTVSAYLKERLEKQGHTVLLVKCDDWILPKSKRAESEQVLENFQQEKLEHDLGQILAGNPLKIDRYKVHSSKPALQKTYQYKNEEVVILDGVTTLSTEGIRDLSDLKLFKEIDESIRKERFIKFYEWKGKSVEEIEELYNLRKSEYLFIEETKQWATQLI
jgi:histidinol-phosphate phosphatase family protein